MKNKKISPFIKIFGITIYRIDKDNYKPIAIILAMILTFFIVMALIIKAYVLGLIPAFNLRDWFGWLTKKRDTSP